MSFTYLHINNEEFGKLRVRDYDDNADKMMKKKNCRVSLFRKRAKTLLTLPATQHEIVLDNFLRETVAGEQCLLYAHTDIQRTADISPSYRWQCDDTEQFVHVWNFSQSYTVHGLVGDTVFPLVFVHYQTNRRLFIQAFSFSLEMLRYRDNKYFIQERLCKQNTTLYLSSVLHKSWLFPIWF